MRNTLNFDELHIWDRDDYLDEIYDCAEHITIDPDSLGEMEDPDGRGEYDRFQVAEAIECAVATQYVRLAKAAWKQAVANLKNERDAFSIDIEAINEESNDYELEVVMAFCDGTPIADIEWDDFLIWYEDDEDTDEDQDEDQDEDEDEGEDEGEVQNAGEN